MDCVDYMDCMAQKPPKSAPHTLLKMFIRAHFPFEPQTEVAESFVSSLVPVFVPFVDSILPAQTARRGAYTDRTGTRISKRGMRVSTGRPSAVTPK